jgi:hypothetical protein
MSHSTFSREEFPVEFEEFDKNRIKCVDIVGNGVLFVLYNVFTKKECNDIITGAREKGFEKLTGYSEKYRNNMRLVIDSKLIIKEMEKRIVDYVKNPVEITEKSNTIHRHRLMFGKWNFDRLNSNLRICRYKPQNKFDKHEDLGYHPDRKSIRSIKTCMVYLNNDFSGGTTRFYNGELDDVDSHKLFYTLKPEPGMCVIFNQCIVHDGEIINDGLKYMMRTDMFYKVEKLYNEPTEQEKKGMSIYEEGEKLEDEAEKCMNDIEKYNSLIKKASCKYIEADNVCSEIDSVCW